MTTGAARSVLVFGVYMLGQGAVLMLQPAWLLAPFGLPVPGDAWVRVVGWTLAVLGLYYVQAARAGRADFFRLSAFVRLAQFGFFGALVATGLGQPVLLAFSAVEAASGVWTLLALRAARAGA
ncbi:MAG: hypothetical protein INH41_25420 [Myxococcaceae bacterium]|jgi:hypothetical protein|nr:hypothetical protein [Myxococcaceae bacterium]MCA3015740.1 hypothetical protein [Myxococcaceae bacterium]